MMAMLGQTQSLSLKSCTGGAYVEGDWVPEYTTGEFTGVIQPANERDTLQLPESWRASAAWKIYTHKILHPVTPEQQRTGDLVIWYDARTQVTRELLIAGGRDYKTTPASMLLTHYKYILIEQQVGGTPS